MSSKQTYDFAEQLEKQKEYFERFVAWYTRMWEPDILRGATRTEEEQGIDLVVRGRDSDLEFSIEVKTEFRAFTTGNICFETVSYACPGQRGKVGWGLKMENTTNIVYIVPGPDDVYIFDVKTLQRWVLEPTVYKVLTPFAARNKGYVTLGVLLPIHRVKSLCIVQGNLNTKDIVEN